MVAETDVLRGDYVISMIIRNKLLSSTKAENKSFARLVSPNRDCLKNFELNKSDISSFILRTCFG